MGLVYSCPARPITSSMLFKTIKNHPLISSKHT